MEELKLLIDMVAHLPQMALWVLIGFLIYKLALVGSIYGVIRLAIEKAHSWATQTKCQYKEVRVLLDGLVLGNETKDALLHELRRAQEFASDTSHNKMYTPTVRWLREAIDAKAGVNRTKG